MAWLSWGWAVTILTSHDQSTMYEDYYFSGEGQSQHVTPSSSRHCMLPVPVASGDVPEVQGDRPVVPAVPCEDGPVAREPF